LTGVGYDVATSDGSNVGTRGGSDVSTRCGSDFGADGWPDVDAHGGAATQMASYPLFLFRDLLFFLFLMRRSIGGCQLPTWCAEVGCREA